MSVYIDQTRSVDTVEGFHGITVADVKFYNDDNISVDMVGGKLPQTT